jgi:hypothetical protein
VAETLEEENARLRSVINAATEFCFRPSFGEVGAWFNDDPEWHYRIDVVWRGEGWWSIRHSSYCWTTTEGWQLEPSSSNRTDEFLAAARFNLPEALRLVPGLLKDVEERTIPHLEKRRAEIQEQYPETKDEPEAVMEGQALPMITAGETRED